MPRGVYDRSKAKKRGKKGKRQYRGSNDQQSVVEKQHRHTFGASVVIVELPYQDGENWFGLEVDGLDLGVEFTASELKVLHDALNSFFPSFR